MECLVCHQKIKSGEKIFWGNQMECCGPGDSDCSYTDASEGLMGALHLFCLNNSTGATRTPNTEVSGTTAEPSAVTRSDALSLLEGV